jgi:high-affinity nickel-transport protein
MKLLSQIKRLWRSSSPALRKRLVLLFIFLAILNGIVLLVTFFTLSTHKTLSGLVVIAYSLGLRHAVDADHIAAIDNTTRKLMSDGRRPVAVGTFFSLGHATIVIVLSLLLAISSSFVTTHLPRFQSIGSLIGTAVSSFFLLLIGIINLIILLQLVSIWREVRKGSSYNDKDLHDHLANRGLLARIFRPLLRSIKASWQMYFVGLLFGLGFDTASEIALLSLAAATGTTSMPIWAIMLLPLAFTAGMALVDSLDGILMLGAYGWAYLSPVRKLYYNLNITLISVVIALLIGGIEALQLVSEKLSWQGIFSRGLRSIDLGDLGFLIIGIFILAWLVSYAVYKIKRYDLL